MTVAYIAILLIPFAIWGVLLVARRVSGANLHPVLRWLRILRWLVFLIGCPLGFVTLVFDRLRWLFPIGLGILLLSSGLSIPEWWLKRHYAPVSLHSKAGGPDSLNVTQQ